MHCALVLLPTILSFLFGRMTDLVISAPFITEWSNALRVIDCSNHSKDRVYGLRYARKIPVISIVLLD